MKRCIKIALLAVTICTTSAAQAEDVVPDFVVEARSAVMTFQKALKQELMSAMQSGGPKKAVEVCHSRAPEIAEEISQKTGWEIGRASLKTRNEKNVPDSSEREILEQFEVRKAKGDPIAKLEWWQENEEAVAYMKAIPMKGICASGQPPIYVPVLS